MQRGTTLAFVAATVLAALPLAADRTAPLGFGMATAQAAVDVDINLFFTSLEPHGVWIPSAEYNYIWVPTSVDRDWSPYSNGRWVWTQEYGWYFVSDEPFAWIVYHYGRWGYDPLVGWYWVPGTKFAGAWVAWRRGTTAVAWAPLPPQGRGYATTVNVSININTVPQYYWRVVPVAQFLAPQLRTVVKPATIEVALFQQTQPAGTVIIQNNVVVNNVINLTFIEQQTKQKVEVVKVAAVDDPQQARNQPATATTEVKAFVAEVKPPAPDMKPTKVVAKAEAQQQARTKDQVDATLAAGKIGALAPTPGEPGAAPANPRCADPAFARSNPRTCPPAGSTAATGGAAGTTTPPAGATGQGTAGTTAATGGASGTTTPPAGATGQGTAGTTAATGGAAGTTTPPAGATGQAQGGAAATATVTPANPRCADAAFARNNPRTCATQSGAPASAGANVTGTGTTTPPAAGANANTGAAAGAATPAPRPAATDPRCANQAFARNNPRTCATSGAANTGASLSPPAGAAAGAAATGSTAATTPQATPPTGTSGQGNADATATVSGGNPRCADAAFARNNPRTCPMPDGAGPNVNAGASASARGGGAQGNVTVQGNVQNERCRDQTFARNNPTICRPVQGNAPAATAPRAPQAESSAPQY
jgi:hypothetical protein